MWLEHLLFGARSDDDAFSSAVPLLDADLQSFLKNTAVRALRAAREIIDNVERE